MRDVIKYIYIIMYDVNSYLYTIGYVIIIIIIKNTKIQNEIVKIKIVFLFFIFFQNFLKNYVIKKFIYIYCYTHILENQTISKNKNSISNNKFLIIIGVYL